MIEVGNKKVMVVGMAKSGFSAARLLLKLGARVLLYDQKPADAFEGIQELLDAGAESRLGCDPEEVAKEAQMLVLSPGVPVKQPFIAQAQKAGKPVISEIELGYRAAQADFVCISGTNGKTTTTALTGQIFSDGGRHTYTLGNIGVPICDKALETRPGDVIVAEVAALQLETIDQFHPRAAALLNLTEDHLNRFGTMQYYGDCKMREFENQTAQDFAVLNLDDPLTAQRIGQIRSHLLLFSRKQEVEEGAYLKNGSIVFRMNGKEQEICPAADVRIPGLHNLENALAAVCLSMCMGIDPKSIAHTLRTFPGVEHRIEFVREVGGVRYINDSKGANPDSTIKAIQTMTAPTILILGGYDKQNTFDDMFAAFTENIVGIVVLGATKQKILKAAADAGYPACRIKTADTFEQAVQSARQMAPKGGAVLLSPACASWDMFKNFEQRGEVFKEIVHGFEECEG